MKTSDHNYGAPVRVERSNPDLVAKTIKVKAALAAEEEARFIAVSASEALSAARRTYEAAEARYVAAVATRKEEERNGDATETKDHD